MKKEGRGRTSLWFFLLKRFTYGLGTLFLIMVLTFLILKILPGGPFEEERALPPEISANLEQFYGLGQSGWMQLKVYLSNILKGEWGVSYRYPQASVQLLIKKGLQVTLGLGVSAFFLVLALGIPVGLLCATKRNETFDRITVLLTLLGTSVPNFLLAALLLYIFSLKWGILPGGLAESPRHFILPVLVLAARPLSNVIRLMRSSALDVLRADYIRTVVAKGLSPRTVLFKHVFFNAAPPVIAYLGPMLAFLLSGSFIVEVVFAMPGLSKHFVMAAFQRDYPLVMTLTLIFSIVILLCSFLSDVLIKLFDPRSDIL